MAERLRGRGRRVVQFATPDYATKSGQELKKRLQSDTEGWSKIPWQEKMRYFAANRLEHKEEVTTALRRGEIVLYDRYVPSSLAFMAIEAGFEDPSWRREEVHKVVEETEYGDNGMPREHLSVFLDVPPEVSASLLETRKQRTRDKDEYTDRLSVQKRLYKEYGLLCRDNPSRFLRVRCVWGDKLLGVGEVAELVERGALEKFPELARSG